MYVVLSGNIEKLTQDLVNIFYDLATSAIERGEELGGSDRMYKDAQGVLEVRGGAQDAQGCTVPSTEHSATSILDQIYTHVCCVLVEDCSPENS
jgi:hypothetical protein